MHAARAIRLAVVVGSHAHELDVIHNNSRPLSIKDAAYAWRQTVFFLALTSSSEQTHFSDWALKQSDGQAEHAAKRSEPVIRGIMGRHRRGETDNAGVMGPAAPSSVGLSSGIG